MKNAYTDILYNSFYL